MSAETKDAVRILDVISVEYRIPNPERYPIYEYIEDGVIKENPGTKRSRDMVLFYDVSLAPAEVKEAFKENIHSLNVKKIIPFNKPKKVASAPLKNAATIENYLSTASETYAGLSKEEAKELGNDYYSITSTPQGYKVEPKYIIRGSMPEELFLKVKAEGLTDELMEKIMPELKELAKKPDGTYELKGESVSIEKQI